MGNATQTRGSFTLVLDAETAADLMTPNPVAIRQGANLREAANLLTEQNVSAVPVLDDAGSPVGVLSRTDVVRYFRDKAVGHSPAAEGSGAVFPSGGRAGPSVREVMTPAFLSVPPATPAVEVVAQLLGLGNVHRLFVVDDAGALVGVVSARDVLRRLRRREAR
jgi:CBS domain-containing protein